MSEARFTKGPWTLTHVSGSNFAVQTFEIRGAFGDKPNVYPIFNRSDAAIDGGFIHVSPENAHLIAAAPDLYEALDRLAKLTPASANAATAADLYLTVRAIANSALAKARGVQP